MPRPAQQVDGFPAEGTNKHIGFVGPMRPENATVIVAKLEDAVRERVVPSRWQLCIELAGDVAAISSGMPEAYRISRRYGRLHQPLPGVIGTGRAGIDQDHIDRLAQVLALVDFSQPVRYRPVPIDHPLSDLGKAVRLHHIAARQGCVNDPPPVVRSVLPTALLRGNQSGRDDEGDAGDEGAAGAACHLSMLPPTAGQCNVVGSITTTPLTPPPPPYTRDHLRRPSDLLR
jgi:hypothetical protein